MNKKQIKIQIKQLKNDLKASTRANDLRLLKLVLVMIALLLVAAFMYGRIQI